MSIQRRLSTQRSLHVYAPQVRIGIHIGGFHRSDSSVRGIAVNEAARLCAAASANGIVMSREALMAGGCRPAGLRKFALKGIKEPVEAAEIAWDT